uniref:Protein-lysine N-methyltransferase SMYD4 n=1 Tax=Cacopsylla melanoneura TaxID=428564 RepID=A0A8D9AGY5_9HEMI
MNTWQELLTDLTETGLVAGDVTRVKSLKEEDKVAYCLSNKHLRGILVDWIRDTIGLMSSGKSSSKSITFRQQGNDKFKNGDDSGAFEFYSKSILFAPPNSPEMALAYANRSATEFHLGHYEDCVADVDQALVHGYSDTGKYKLIARKGKCLMKLNKYINAIKLLNEALNLLEKLDKVPQSKRIALKQDIQEALSSSLKMCRLQEKSSALDLKEDVLTVERSEENNCVEAMSMQMSSTSSSVSSSVVSLPSLTSGESHILACASNKIKMQTSNVKGRHVIAVEDVHRGDTLFVEKPVAFVILPPCSFSHCNHCCTSISAPIPCNECILAVYCSEVCRSQAWSLYHRWECHGALHFLETVGIAHLALKLILISGTSERYNDVYHLETHLQDMRPEDLYQYVLTATLLTLYLEQFTDYLSSPSPLPHLDPSLPLTLDIGHRILRHIGQLICNGHAITKLGVTESTPSDPDGRNGEVVGHEQVRIATAIFPSASMMNHSCDPNIINSFSDQYLIVRAAKDIPSGTEVLNCYGPHFRRMRVADRKAALREQYHFVCVCAPCCSPNQTEYQERSYGLLCPQCEGPLLQQNEEEEGGRHVLTCGDCGHAQNGAKLIKMDLTAHALFKQGLSLVEKGDIGPGLNELLKCLDMRRKCLYKYNKDLLYTQDVLAKCHAMLGQYKESVQYIEQCLEGVEHIYGETSIELSNELNKLTDVMMSNVQGDPDSIDKEYINKIRHYVHTSREIVELHYGVWNNEYKAILEKQDALEKLIKAKRKQ